MANLDELFGPATQPWVHPRVRDWRARGIERVAFKQPRNGPLFEPAKLFAYGPVSGTEGAFRPEIGAALWERALHEDLVAARIKATTPANEAHRFGYALRELLEPVEARYGDGFFSACVVQYALDAGVAASHNDDLRPYLRECKDSSPDRGDREDCRQAIESVLHATALDLTMRLGYSVDEAKPILDEALFRYLDDRFSISSRRLLGLG